MKKLYLLLPLSLLGLVGCDATKVSTTKIVSSNNQTTITNTNSSKATTTTSSSNNNEQIVNKNYEIVTNFTGYYENLNGKLDDSATFKSALNSILVSTHKTKLNYAGARDNLKITDVYDGTNVECLYTGVRYTPESFGSTWNREHIWAKSHGFNAESYTAYSDIHHLRVTEIQINNHRDNSYFAEVDHETSSKDDYGNYWTSDVFEPRDEVKGDVARMCFYMVCRYSDSTLNLTLTDDTSDASMQTTGEGYLGLLSTLVKWSFEDPVDSRELSRNEAIAKVQGNRNPFIDHPEFVSYLYPEETEACGVSSSNILDKVQMNLKDDEAIQGVETMISNLSSSSTSEEIEAASAAYYALDEVSQSFVKNYEALSNAEFNNATNNGDQDISASATFDLANVGSKEGKTLVNGIGCTYTGANFNAGMGLYANTTTNVVCAFTNTYDVDTMTFVITSNKNSVITGSIVISDGTNSVTVSVSSTGTQKQTVSYNADVTSIDFSKDISVTLKSSAASLVLQTVIFNS